MENILTGKRRIKGSSPKSLKVQSVEQIQLGRGINGLNHLVNTAGGIVGAPLVDYRRRRRVREIQIGHHRIIVFPDFPGEAVLQGKHIGYPDRVGGIELHPIRLRSKEVHDTAVVLVEFLYGAIKSESGEHFPLSTPGCSVCSHGQRKRGAHGRYEYYVRTVIGDYFLKQPESKRGNCSGSPSFDIVVSLRDNRHQSHCRCKHGIHGFSHYFCISFLSLSVSRGTILLTSPTIPTSDTLNIGANLSLLTATI